MHKIIASLAVLAAFSATAHAQDTERFQLQKTDNGYVRMDTLSGAIAICQQNESELVCRAARDGEPIEKADDTAALNKRIRDLEARVTKLETQNLDKPAVPTEQEFDQGLDRMESAFRRFLGIVREFEGPQEPQPNRT